MGWSMTLAAVTPESLCWLQSEPAALKAFFEALWTEETERQAELRAYNAPTCVFEDVMRKEVHVDDDCPGIYGALGMSGRDEEDEEFQDCVAFALFEGTNIGADDYAGGGPPSFMLPPTVRTAAAGLEDAIPIHVDEWGWLEDLCDFFRRAAREELAVIKYAAV